MLPGCRQAALFFKDINVRFGIVDSGQERGSWEVDAQWVSVASCCFLLRNTQVRYGRTSGLMSQMAVRIQVPLFPVPCSLYNGIVSLGEARENIAFTRSKGSVSGRKYSL